jgi:hypothetical protein
MTTKLVPTTIKLGDIDLDVFQLPDGSYASEGLFRLAYTDVYRYGECWYWLGSDATPPIDEYRCWDWDWGAFLSLHDNKLSYLFVDPIDPEREIDEDNVEISYSPVPNDVGYVIGFCIKGHLVSDEDMYKLNRMLDGCHSGGTLNRAANKAFLLRDTEQDLPKPRSRGIAAENKSPSNQKKPSRKMPEKRSGLIYLVKLDAHLKLGFTQDLPKRLKAFQTTNARVELVKSVKGTLCREKRLHSILGSKVRELYDFEDEQRIIDAMGD